MILEYSIEKKKMFFIFFFYNYFSKIYSLIIFYPMQQT